jgi:hypothetical protein
MKGILFTFIILTIVLALVSFIAIQRTLITYYTSRITIENRVNAMKSLYDSIVSDATKALEIISRRAISAAVSWVITNGVGLVEANETIAELIINGSINGTLQPLMEAATLIDWKNKLEELGYLEGFETKINFTNLEVKPLDSWNLLVEIRINVSLADLKGIANLTRSEKLKTPVSILGFEDPLYPLNTLGRGVNVIVKSPHFGNHTIENLTEDLNNSYYHPSLEGASFLDRLEGKFKVQQKYNLTKNIVGLESFVDKEDLLTLGLPVYVERSNVDYIYFSGEPILACRVQGMPESFRIDIPHAVVYGVNESLIC